ncbi:MAG: hypothetical protein GX069_10820 [Tissierellia bacterium]|nr:hypothetical protein [Tissierellia bacterium]
MKKIKKSLLVLCFIPILLGTSIAFSDAGTIDDPLVSLSYFEKKMEELKDYIDTKLKELKEEKETTSPTAAASFEVVELKAGQFLIGKGGTEIILRGGTGNGRGRAKIVAAGQNGLSDITQGKDLTNGEEVPLNHLLIVPRDDGRGVFAITDSVYLVKGDYEIR